jgi:hypothetical protein
MTPLHFQLLADTVLLLHFGIAAFVVGGLVLVFAGNRCAWAWVNGWRFRVLHLAAVGVIVVESWMGVACPLTRLESWLRTRAGMDAYSQSFIEHWVQRVLFYDAPSWVFISVYTLFGLLVAAAWYLYPPRYKR